jgi:hypothetical protein
MTALTIIELELTPAIWTPQAQILCAICHNKGHGGTWGFGSEEQPLDDAMDQTVGFCDECGKFIWMPYKMAWEQKIVHALKEKGLDARMAQTGGMCSAAELFLLGDEDGGHKYVWITESEDVDTPHDAPTFMVGFYHEQKDGEWDSDSEYTILPFDEAIALVQKIYKEGRFNA